MSALYTELLPFSGATISFGETNVISPKLLNSVSFLMIAREGIEIPPSSSASSSFDDFILWTARRFLSA